MLSWATSQGGPQLGGDGVERRRHLLVGDPQVVDGDAVELPGELPNGRVALGAAPGRGWPAPPGGLGQPIAAERRGRQQPAQMSPVAPRRSSRVSTPGRASATSARAPPEFDEDAGGTDIGTMMVSVCPPAPN